MYTAVKKPAIAPKATIDPALNSTKATKDNEIKRSGGDVCWTVEMDLQLGANAFSNVFALGDNLHRSVYAINSYDGSDTANSNLEHRAKSESVGDPYALTEKSNEKKY